MNRWIMAALVAGATLARGQMGGPGPGDDGSRHLAKVLGKDLAFSARAVTTMTGGRRPLPAMESGYAVLEGQVRIETDLTKMAGGDMPAQALAQMKALGMDRSVMLHRADRPVSYLIYPGKKAYVELTAPGPAREQQPPKIDRVETGKETVEGHPCVKFKVTITDETGRATVIFVWEATDLKNFPIKTQTATAEGTATTVFKDIKVGKPAAELFEVPANYKKFPSVQALLMAGMGGMMGGDE